jgi:hypothetical protein
MSVSKTHNLKNVRREREESLADFVRIVELVRAQPADREASRLERDKALESIVYSPSAVVL